MKKSIMVLGALATLSAAGVAMAGGTSFGQVSFGTTVTSGTLVGARNASDSTQFIQCNTYAYDSGNEYGSCYAKNSTGSSRQCFAANAEQLAVMRSISSSAYIAFTIAADGSTCEQVSISNGSNRAQY